MNTAKQIISESVQLFDSPEMATMTPFRYLQSVSDDSLFLITGLAVKDKNNHQAIQVIDACSSFNLAANSTLDEVEFNKLKDSYNLIAIGEVH